MAKTLKIFLIVLFAIVLILCLEFILIKNFNTGKTLKKVSALPIIPKTVSLPLNSYTPVPSPSSAPLTFAQINNLYGPCASVPVIFYHHIEDLNQAQKEGHKSLTVDPKIFASQMQYLKNKKYNPITMKDMNNFFDSGINLPARPIVISFDDGYNDFDSNVMPVIQSLGLHVVMFLPTGLVNNPGYLTWDQVTSEAGTGLVYFANHSWSHASLATSIAVTNKEVDTSQTQLVDRGLNPDMALAYPYGTYAQFTLNLLAQKGFKLAFTTTLGTIQCKARRLFLPRIRIGNAPLAAYGF